MTSASRQALPILADRHHIGPAGVVHNEPCPRSSPTSRRRDSPRVSLRRAHADDADAVLSYRRQPSVSQWVGEPPEDFRARFAAPERLDLLLMVEREGVVIGDLMIKVLDAWAPVRAASQAHGVQAELGWCLRPEDTGDGYATEGVEAVLGICFVDLGLRRVTASCFAANTASSRLMERVGMRREAHG